MKWMGQLLGMGGLVLWGVMPLPALGQGKKPPPVEKITESVYRVGTILIDTQNRTITCPGEVNMERGALEYLAVTARGKTHESLLKLNVRPLHLQVALLLLGREPKNVLKYQGDKTTPQGDPMEIWVRWRDAAGTIQETRVEEWVAETPGNRPMPRTPFVFTGSRITSQGFQADLDGSLIALYHDPAALLDNPLPGGSRNIYVVQSKRVPKRGTPLELILKVPSPPARKATSSRR